MPSARISAKYSKADVIPKNIKRKSLNFTKGKNIDWDIRLQLRQEKKIGDWHRGKIISVATKEKMRLSQLGRPKHSKESREKMSQERKGRKSSNETKKKMRDYMIGKKFPIVCCPHCGVFGGKSAMGKWHFKNCKKRA